MLKILQHPRQESPNNSMQQTALYAAADAERSAWQGGMTYGPDY